MAKKKVVKKVAKKVTKPAPVAKVVKVAKVNTAKTWITAYNHDTNKHSAKQVSNETAKKERLHTYDDQAAAQVQADKLNAQ